MQPSQFITVGYTKSSRFGRVKPKQLPDAQCEKGFESLFAWKQFMAVSAELAGENLETHPWNFHVEVGSDHGVFL